MGPKVSLNTKYNGPIIDSNQAIGCIAEAHRKM